MCYNLLKDNIRDAATRRVFHIGATVRAANPLRFFIMRTPTGIPANESVFKFDIHAVGLTTRKRRGEAAEAAFLAKASGLGFGVAKPWGDSERYDFLLDSGHVPIQAFASRKNLRFYPHGGRKALYEKYREAWCLMACPRSAQIEPAQIEPDCASLNQALASCRCEQLSVRCAVCPLCPLPTSFHLVIPNPLQR